MPPPPLGDCGPRGLVVSCLSCRFSVSFYIHWCFVIFFFSVFVYLFMGLVVRLVTVKSCVCLMVCDVTLLECVCYGVMMCVLCVWCFGVVVLCVCVTCIWWWSIAPRDVLHKRSVFQRTRLQPHEREKVCTTSRRIPLPREHYYYECRDCHVS